MTVHLDTIPPRLHIGAAGQLRGRAAITRNDPWPTKNCSLGFEDAWGGAYHTEVGNEHAVIHEFNDPAAQASAFFSIAMLAGAIHQYIPLGQNLKAWTQAAGNPHWRGVEHEDHGNPENPLSRPQLIASAQVFEAMSTYDGWRLQATDDPNKGRGIIFHSDGGAAWGNHDCPGAVRRKQRDDILFVAHAIRAGAAEQARLVLHITQGQSSLADLAHKHGTTAWGVLDTTADHNKGNLPLNVRKWVNGVMAGQISPKEPVPAGFHLYVPR